MSGQIVQVTFGVGERWYTYEWTGEPELKVTDRVIVPPNWANQDYSFATVMQLGSKYEGDVSKITGVVDQSTQEIRYAPGCLIEDME